MVVLPFRANASVISMCGGSLDVLIRKVYHKRDGVSDIKFKQGILMIHLKPQIRFPLGGLGVRPAKLVGSCIPACSVPLCMGGEVCSPTAWLSKWTVRGL